MARSVRLVPALLVSALALTACAGVHGTPGGSGVQDPLFPKAGNGGYDVSHYGLRLAYTPGTRLLTGTATLTARATEDLSAFDLDLRGLEVEKVTVGGETARWNRAGQELTVRPHDDIRRDETFRVTVRYSGVPETVTDPDGSEEGWLRTTDGVLALGEPVGSMAWFPGNHHPSDKAAYDLTVTVPRGLRAVSNGELRSETSAGGRTTFRWHSGEPMASYLAVLAIGRFDIGRSRTGDGLPVYTAVDPAEAEASRPVLARIPEVLRWAERRFGPYPFSATGAIVDHAPDVGYALETQSRPVFPGAPDLTLLVHELVHQWYGDSVTPESWRDMWLNEGFATYAEWLWQEDHGGESAQETFDALYSGDYFDSEGAAEAIWEFPPTDPPDAARISDPPVYLRGAMVLQKVRQAVGDESFWRILRGWAKRYRYGNADTADFTAYVEKQAPGEDFEGIWEDWLYGAGKPQRG
ncbi:metallopeptidase [Streptomyces viridochromogenes DSM 40736]|uniref:Aminopeptidase N n=1 Tax=Streptomyces viridochromogenes (strain DSM 40736 / JCM 4977 / BCRC 1201 / Tue 494) TaxID=591159 RepID=D9WXJ3_STRVT|nr:M1 family metallopeptidase [Streptomyces viridochromogenes]EFL33038.1 metallopeptidase [Streptomyces viridochromogenes DSM 40736]